MGERPQRTQEETRTAHQRRTTKARTAHRGRTIKGENSAPRTLKTNTEEELQHTESARKTRKKKVHAGRTKTKKDTKRRKDQEEIVHTERTKTERARTTKKSTEEQPLLLLPSALACFVLSQCCSGLCQFFRRPVFPPLWSFLLSSFCTIVLPVLSCVVLFSPSWFLVRAVLACVLLS